MKWKEDKYPNWDEKHRLDFHWIENKEKRINWIKEHYYLTEKELNKLVNASNNGEKGE